MGDFFARFYRHECLSVRRRERRKLAKLATVK